MGAPAVIMGVGIGINAVSQIISGNAQADAAQKDAALKRLQADQVEKNAARDEALLAQQGHALIGEQTTAYAKSGVELSGTPLLMLEQTNAKVREQSIAIANDAAFRASQLRAGADISEDLGSDRQTAGYLGAAGSLLTGAGQYYLLKDTNTKSKGQL